MSDQDSVLRSFWRYIAFVIGVVIICMMYATHMGQLEELQQMKQLMLKTQQVMERVAQNTNRPYLTYDRLDNGWYSVTRVVNKYDGTAILKQSLPIGDAEHIVVGVPQGLLDSKEPFQVFRSKYGQ